MYGKINSPDVLYSKKDHKRVNSLLRAQLAFMAVMGMTPYVIEEWFPRVLRGLGRFLSYFYSGFVIMQTLHTILLFAKTTFDVFPHGDLNAITDALAQISIISTSCFSTCYWLWHRNDLRKFVAFINSNYWHHSLAGLTYVSSFESYRKAHRIAIYWLVSTISGATLWAITPLLQGSHTLPLNCWYPFDPLQPWVYFFVYVLQAFTQLNLGISIGSGSALYVSLIVLMLGQFDVLFCSLKNLQYHAQFLCGENLDTLRDCQGNLRTPENDELNQYVFSHEKLTDLSIFQQMPEILASQKRCMQAALQESLAKCVQLHRFISECCRTMEALYSPFCLAKSIQISIQLCLLVFVGVAGERSLMRVFNLFQYMALTLIELMLFTYWGELLQLHSVRSGEAFWRSNWQSYAKLIRKDVMIFLVNSQCPIKLTAGKFFIMGTDRLRLVIMQAFSFLTLLQNLAAKNK